MKAYYNDIDPYCCAVLRKNIAAGNLPEGKVDERDIREVRGSDLVGYGHIHLFAGIGGFPLGLLRAGVPGDWRILTGGFPCQDISNAGKREGITGERSGLWKEIVRLIQETSACGVGFDYILLENVSALTGRGLDTVLGDLTQARYDAEWITLRASDFGAPHERERIFIVAYPNGNTSRLWERSNGQAGPEASGRGAAALAYPYREGLQTAWSREQSTVSIKRSEAMAHTAIQRLSQPGPSGFATSATQTGTGMESQLERCGDVAHASGSGWKECDPATVSDGTGHVTWRNLAPGNVKPLVEDSTSGRERQHQESRGENWSQPLTLQSGAGHAQPLLGRIFAGLSDWLDRYQWPAGPGQAQHEWEPTRTTQEKVPHRVARLKALGNSIVPQCAEYIGYCIRDE